VGARFDTAAPGEIAARYRGEHDDRNHHRQNQILLCPDGIARRAGEMSQLVFLQVVPFGSLHKSTAANASLAQCRERLMRADRS
jgi:hypothetical protein